MLKFFFAFMPCYFAVIAAYWSFYFVNQELAYPGCLDSVLPIWADHVSSSDFGNTFGHWF